MKRFLPLLLTTAMLLSGCGGVSSSRTECPAAGMTTIYTSAYPFFDFAEKIVGDKAYVECLVTPGGEPHDWEPSPADIVKLENADVFIYGGLGLEHWVDGVLDSLQNQPVLVKTSSVVAQPLGIEDGHDHDDEDDHDHEEDDDHGHGDFDPHTWLSPLTAKAQMELIKDAICGVDPDNADYYEENYRRYAEEFDNLHEEYLVRLAPYAGREIIVSHQAFGYLCRDYFLYQVAVRGFSPDGEPAPADMAAVIAFAKDHLVKVIFFESAASPAVADAIAKEIGAETDILYPIESAVEGEDYFSLMHRNLDALIGAFS